MALLPGLGPLDGLRPIWSLNYQLVLEDLGPPLLSDATQVADKLFSIALCDTCRLHLQDEGLVGRLELECGEFTLLDSRRPLLFQARLLAKRLLLKLPESLHDTIEHRLRVLSD